jgi:anti-sigma factor RsiW
MTNRPDHSTYREWLHLEADGRLSREEQSRLDEHLASCPECRDDLAELRAVDDVLQQHRIAVRPDFRDQVLASLPSTGWEARHPRTWAFPAAAFVLLGVLSAFVLGGMGGTAPLGESTGLGAVLAVGGLIRATLLAGSGLLAATWKGVGLVFEEMLSSPVSLGVFAVLVVSLNLLLLSLIRRKRPEPAAAPARSLDQTRG